METTFWGEVQTDKVLLVCVRVLLMCRLDMVGRLARFNDPQSHVSGGFDP